MKWVTWKNIGVDRMGCIWLIHRWIDQDAEFIFVPTGEKLFPEHGEPGPPQVKEDFEDRGRAVGRASPAG